MNLENATTNKEASNDVTIKLFSPKKLLRFIGLCIAILFIMHAAALTLHHGLGYQWAMGFVPMVHFDGEGNLPAIFSAALLLTCAGALFLVARYLKPSEARWPWYLLSAVFAFLAFDEALSIHERLIPLMRDILPVDGPLYYGWVVPYAGLVLILAAYYLPWTLRQPTPIRNTFVIGGALYVGGAIGMEMLGGWYYSTTDVPFMDGKTRHLAGDLILTLEELGEMTGLMIFAYGVALKLCGPRGGIYIHQARQP